MTLVTATMHGALASTAPVEIGYYVYAIARAHAGIEPTGLPSEGIAPGIPVRLVTHRDLFAVASPVLLAEFEPAALAAHLRDPVWLSERVLAHQRVLASLLQGYTLLPLKFGTLYTREERIQDVLARHYGTLVTVISRLDGACEWGVKLYCDRQAVAAWIERTSETLRQQRIALDQATVGGAYLLGRRLARATEEACARVVDACAQTAHTGLAAHARQTVVNPVQLPAAHGRAAEMVFNAAYLVDDANLAAFRIVLQTLEDHYAPQGFHLELTGPWPPYNFASLNEALACA